MVVFLFNYVIYVSLLLCLRIIILCVCIFIVMHVVYSVSLCCFVYCLCVNVYLQLPPGLNPVAVNKIYQYSIVFKYFVYVVRLYSKNILFITGIIFSVSLGPVASF